MIRLDKLLTEKGLIEGRQTASDLIEDGGVRVNGKLVTKPGKSFQKKVKLNCSNNPSPGFQKGRLS